MYGQAELVSEAFTRLSVLRLLIIVFLVDNGPLKLIEIKYNITDHASCIVIFVVFASCKFLELLFFEYYLHN